MNSMIDDFQLAVDGKNRMAWFRESMPIITRVNELLKKKQTFAGKTIAICMHIEPKTAYWIEGLLGGGAKHIYLVGCVGTTKPDTASHLASLKNMTVLGKKADTLEDHQHYVTQILQNKIDLFLDNGASLILAYEKIKPDWKILGANEETRTGKILIEKENISFDYPIIVIDDSPVKQLLENEIGVGTSVVDGFMRSTSLLIGGKKILVIGYGYCGAGVAKKFNGLGANTMVYDINPLSLLKAKVDGHQIGELEELIPQADVIITVTGQFDVITEKHIPLFKDKVILGNAGHYGLEINVAEIKRMSLSQSEIKVGIEQLDFENKKIYILHQAAPMNLAGAVGNPIEIMDLGLGLQSYSAKRIIENRESLPLGTAPVPSDITNLICREMLEELN